MALEFIDSCQHMGDTVFGVSTCLDVSFKWTVGAASYTNAANGAPVRRSGDSCLSIGASGIASKTLQYESSRTVGCAGYFSASGGPGSNIITFLSGGQTIVQLRIEADGTISLYTGASGRAWNSGSTYVLTFDVYHYFELTCSLSGASPITFNAEVMIDGNNISGPLSGSTGVNASALICGAATMNQFSLSPGYYQDIYCLNANSSDINGRSTSLTSFLGDVEIDAIFPDADSGPNNFSVGAGSGTPNWGIVNLDPPTGDNSYLYDSSTGAQENYNMTPLSGFVGVILGAQLCIYAKKDAEGSRAFEALLNTASIKNLYGTNQYLYDYYDYFLYPLDTLLGTSWTESNFNSAAFGLEITV